MSTVYYFAYYYNSGDGSNDSDPYTDKKEAIEAFKELVRDEIIADFTQEDDVIDYAKLWSVEEEPDEELDSDGEQTNILFWTFEHGYTDYDPPSK